jgi:hypothetical protein
VSARERRERLGVKGGIVLVTGDGARALAFAIERALFDRGGSAVVVAGGAPAQAVREAGLIAIVVVEAGSPTAAGDDETLVIIRHAGTPLEADARTAVGSIAARGWVK